MLKTSRPQTMRAAAVAAAFGILVVVATLTHGARTAQVGGFPDVSLTHPYAQSIAYVRMRGIVQGYPDGMFRPDQSVNRAELTKMLIGTNSTDTERTKCVASLQGVHLFNDVHDAWAVWYGPFLCIAKAQGVITGYPDGTFKGERTLIFAEAAAIVVRSFRMTPDEQDSGAPWYAPYLTALQTHEAIPPTMLALEQEPTRAEIAYMIEHLAIADEDVLSGQRHGAAQDGEPQRSVFTNAPPPHWIPPIYDTTITYSHPTSAAEEQNHVTWSAPWNFNVSTSSTAGSVASPAWSPAAQSSTASIVSSPTISANSSSTSQESSTLSIASSAPAILSSTPSSHTTSSSISSVASSQTSPPSSSVSKLSSSSVHSEDCPQGIIVQYSIPTPDSGPRGIAVGSDGNLWFTEYVAGQIGRITPNGVVTEYSIPTGSSGPLDIAAGDDGNLWFTEWDTERIGRITPSGVVTEYATAHIPEPGNRTTSITRGPDGNMWFTTMHGNTVGKITSDGRITEYPLPNYVSPWYITSGPDGNLWFTASNGLSIGKITVNGNVTEYPINITQLGYDIVSGADGNLWFTSGNPSQIVKVTPNGTATRYVIPTASGNPYGITAGPDGNIWFTDGLDGDRIGRITPNGTITEYEIPGENNSPYNITTGPDGNIWFTLGQSNKIGKLIVSCGDSAEVQ